MQAENLRWAAQQMCQNCCLKLIKFEVSKCCLALEHKILDLGLLNDVDKGFNGFAVP
jgi:hypothetical protein